MRGEKRPWWGLTRTKGHALALGLLWTVVAALQLSTALVGDVEWWRWIIASAMAALGVFYLAAWRVRSMHEAADRDRG